MKSKTVRKNLVIITIVTVFTFLVYGVSFALPLTDCLYSVIDIDTPGGNYQLNYELENIALSPYLNFLTLWFNGDNVRHFDFVSASTPLNWSYTQIGPYSGYNNWRLKFETSNPADFVLPGGSLSGFSIVVNSFDGSVPGSQPYDAGDGHSESGQTSSFSPPPNSVPEPSTLILLGSGLIGVGGFRLVRNKKKTNN